MDTRCHCDSPYYCEAHDEWAPGGYLFEKMYAEYQAEYADLRCLSFRNGEHEYEDGTVIWHFDKDCGAPHCPWFTPVNKLPLELVADHSLGSRDELLSHIQRCADREWSYEDIYAEAYRVERADRPGEPWTDKDIVPMIEGALRKAPAHIAENKARADEDQRLWAAFGLGGAAAPDRPDYPVTRVRHGKKRIQWPM